MIQITEKDVAKLVDALSASQAENAALRAELERQWKAAHENRCVFCAPNSRCHCPKPAILEWK